MSFGEPSPRRNVVREAPEAQSPLITERDSAWATATVAAISGVTPNRKNTGVNDQCSTSVPVIRLNTIPPKPDRMLASETSQLNTAGYTEVAALCHCIKDGHAARSSPNR